MIKINPELHTLVWGTESWHKPPKPFEHLLFKVIDAKDKLSVQVHPGDDYAEKHENGSLGKTEVWYILDAKPGANLVYGLKPGVTKKDFENAVVGGDGNRPGNPIENLLKFVPARKGDIFFIPAGLVHAIGEGIILAELQQNSDITYRVYDYNRKPERELHISKALDVVEEGCGGCTSSPVICEYFSMEEVKVADEFIAPEACLVFALQTRELFYINTNEKIKIKGKMLLMK